MFRARKPSLKRSQQDETPRKRARLTPAAAKASPEVRETPIAKASPVLKTSPVVTRRTSARKLLTKSATKVQTRIRFPVAKRKELRSEVLDLTSSLDTDNPLVDAEAESKQRQGSTENKTPKNSTRETGTFSIEGVPASVTPTCAVQHLETEVKSATKIGSLAKHAPVLASRKRLDFDAESAVDDCTTASVDDDDTQSLESPDRTKLWPPYEPSDELLCRAHDHRLIKPEDDPILDAALELLL